MHSLVSGYRVSSISRGNFNVSSAPATSSGMSLGTSTSNNATNSFSPSKSDSVPVAFWYRGGNNNSILSGNRAASINSSDP